MDLQRFGATRRDVPVIGQGTWYNEDDDPTAALAALRKGLSLGMIHIDTAEMYGSGAAEEIEEIEQAFPLGRPRGLPTL
jgi:diketogulonate reductase-like aldo/keto reductase